MNPNTNPPNPPNNPPPPFPEPLSATAPASLLIETLLKRPLQLVWMLREPGSGRASLLLAAFAMIALAAYGLVVGSFSGGEQWLAAPLKISLGAFGCMLICLPSLFIFSCLAGAEVSLRGLVGVLGAALALMALLLIGFVPVAWIFSQSTESIAFIGTLHLFLWLIAVSFGLRLLRVLHQAMRVTDRLHLRIWSFIFILVSLQMTTALRPLLGKSEHWLPQEKKFFAAHWAENLVGAPTQPARE